MERFSLPFHLAYHFHIEGAEIYAMGYTDEELIFEETTMAPSGPDGSGSWLYYRPIGVLYTHLNLVDSFILPESFKRKRYHSPLEYLLEQ
jgi:hypothetical protein